MSEGWIKLHRKLFSHFLWDERRSFSRFEAWMDLIQSAAYLDDNSTLIDGKLIKWNRSQYPASLSFLSTRWRWSISKTRGFLNLLEKDGMITKSITQGITVITLCNYDTYNAKPQAESTSTASQGQGEGKERTTNQGSKTIEYNLTEREREHALDFLKDKFPERFKEWWDRYRPGFPNDKQQCKEEKDKFTVKFNSKVVLEDIPFEEVKLFAFLGSFTESWVDNLKKDKKGTTGPQGKIYKPWPDEESQPCRIPIG